jgi:hypothetical protein
MTPTDFGLLSIGDPNLYRHLKNGRNPRFADVGSHPLVHAQASRRGRHDLFPNDKADRDDGGTIATGL